MHEKIAIIGGTGDLGLGLALRWASAGIEIVIGSRDEQKARDAAQRVRDLLKLDVPVTGLENAAACAGASTVVLAVPFPAQAATLKSIRGSLADAILVDATVPLAATVGGQPTRILGVWQGSAAAQARELAPAGTRVVSAFHNVSAEVLQDLSAVPDCDVLICGDDPGAKKALSTLITRIPGLRPIDAGPLEMARIVESLTALLISVNRRYKVKHSGIRITGVGAEVPGPITT